MPVVGPPARDVVGLHDDSGGYPLGREGLLHLVVGLDHREVARELVDVGRDALHPERRDREGHQQTAREQQGQCPGAS